MVFWENKIGINCEVQEQGLVNKRRSPVSVALDEETQFAIVLFVLW